MNIFLSPVGELDRTTYLGGSDIAGILNVSPWKNPLDIYLDKITPDLSQKNKQIFERGKKMEPYIIDIFSEVTKKKIIARGNRYRDSQYPFLASEIDAETEEGENVEIKTVSPFKSYEWGQECTDEIPIHYIVQAMHGLYITKRTICLFGVLIGCDDFRIYKLNRNEKLINHITKEAVMFWDRIKRRDPPPLKTVNNVLRLFKKDNGKMIEANDSIINDFIKLKKIKKEKKEIIRTIKEIEDRIKLFMKDHALLTINGKPIISWTSNDNYNVDIYKLKKNYPEIFCECSHRNTTRIFRIKNT